MTERVYFLSSNTVSRAIVHIVILTVWFDTVTVSKQQQQLKHGYGPAGTTTSACHL